jgi:S-adenosylmethionine:tRNA ribosyltransferase-isomerase
VLLTDFHFDLPAELIAQQPLAERSASRLLHLDGAAGSVADLRFAALPSLLRRGDLLVFNDTRVVAARIHGRKPSGGAVELLLECAVGEREALVQGRSSKGLRDGQSVVTAGGVIEVLAREGEFWRVRLPAPVHDFFDAHGEVPLPPYIERSANSSDRERYQSVLARHPGAVAAPTASLHFDAPLLAALETMGVERVCVTLHVGQARSSRCAPRIRHSMSCTASATCWTPLPPARSTPHARAAGGSLRSGRRWCACSRRSRRSRASRGKPPRARRASSSARGTCSAPSTR